jgi:glutathione S-transferase
MSRTLVGISFSLYVRKVRFVLTHKNLDYTIEQSFPSQDPAFLAKSPLGKVPYYTDGDFTISDSSVICHYIDKKEGGASLYPADPQAFAKALWLEEYSDTKVTEFMSGLVFQKIAKPQFFGQETDLEAVRQKEAMADSVLSYLEKVAPKTGFAVGPEVSIADFALATNFVNYTWAGYKIDATKYPTLAAYEQRLLELPAVKKVMTAEKAEIEKMKK